MKVEVKIPKGNYCNACPFLREGWPRDYQCNLMVVKLHDDPGGHISRILKDADCPSLKEEK